MAKILFLEPYFGGSHKAFAEGLRRASVHEIDLVTLPGRFWRWRMRGSAPEFARRLADRGAPDLLFASSMLPLAEFLGLAGDQFRRAPRAVYFHENQLTYPLPEGEKRDLHLVMSQVSTGLAADRILFNSEHQRSEFLAALPAFLRALPDHRPTGILSRFRDRSSVIPPGVDFESIDKTRPAKKSGGAPRTLLWNHRWEHDKGRDLLADLIERLRERSVPFRLIVTGAPRGARSDVFEELPRIAGDHLHHVGFARSRAAYARLLRQADVVLSTARHEFFGISMLEAIRAGAFPLFPKALAYPEIVDPSRFSRCYYESREQMREGVEKFLAEGPPPVDAIREVTGRFSWTEVVPRFDDFFDRLLAGRS